MKNCCPVEMESETQKVESIEFEPVTLAHGNENLFVLFEIISHGIGQFVMIICEINLSTD